MLKKAINTTTLTWAIFFSACKNVSKQNESAIVEIGKETYQQRCLSCHSQKDNSTLYQPSLVAMSNQSDSIFHLNLKKIEIDTLHPPYLKGAEIDALINYIRSYKEMKIIALEY